MKPTDYRNETWDSLQARMKDSLCAVLTAWRTHGPGTTREVAARSGIDILTFRPRTTELHQLGFVTLDDGSNGRREGVYRAFSDDEALAEFERRTLAARTAPAQAELKLATA
jgi:hypothetical protein